MIAALAGTGLPPLGWRQLSSTQFDFVPVAMIVVAFTWFFALVAVGLL